MTVLFSDDFNRANGNLPSGSANWSWPGTDADFNVASNTAVSDTLGSNGINECVNGAVAGMTDGYVQAVIGSPAADGAGIGYGVVFRYVVGTGAGYAVIANASGWVLYLLVGSDFGSSIGSGSDAFSNGDVLRLEFEGTTWRVKQNGVQLATGTDATTASGTPGIAYSSTASTGFLDDFEAGTLAAPATAEQEGHLWRDDDGDEDGASALAAQDSNITRATETATRLRVLINASGDLPSTQYQLEYRLSGGAYAKVPLVASGPGTTPLIESGDATVTTIGAASDPWPINVPNASTGDKLVFILAWDDSTNVTAVTPPAGQNGETISSIEGPIASASTEMRMQAWSCVCTGTWTAGTISFDPSDAETCRAVVLKIPAGEVDSVTPIGAHSNSASTTTTDTTLESPAFSAGSSDGGGRLVIAWGSDADAITAPGSGVSTVNNATGGGVGLLVATRDTAVSNSESIASLVATIAGDSWACIAFIVRAPIVDHPIAMAASANIAASGENTTAQLTAPSGKSTSDFVAGRMQDDENPADAVDITADDYTEMEWCIQATSFASASEVYEFRVTANGTALATYSVTPTMTIAGGGGAVGIDPSIHRLIALTATSRASYH